MALDDVKQSIISNVTNAYEKALDKGATEPENKNLENLADTIDSIQGGTTLGYHVRSVINPDGETQTLKIISGENITLQDKTATPSEETQTITADEGYFAIENMTVEAIPSDYVGSAVQKLEETTYTPTTTDIVINAYQYLNGSQIVKGDVNLVPENIAKDVELFGVVGTHAGGGGETGGIGQAFNVGVSEAIDTAGEIVNLRPNTFRETGTLTRVSLPNCERIGSSAFFSCFYLSEVVLPQCTKIDSSAFYSCGRLSILSIPKCEYIESNAFHSCPRLSNLEGPAVKSIANSAFKSCTRLETVKVDVATYIGSFAFNSCSVLAEVIAPELIEMGSYAFGSCSLASINFPKCTTMGQNGVANNYSASTIYMPELTFVPAYGIMYCTTLSEVSLPKVGYVSQQGFANCSNLQTVDLPMCTTVGYQAFKFCSKLTNISLPACTTVQSQAFSSCYALRNISLPACTYISASAFVFCSSLATVVINNSTCRLGLSNAFTNTPMLNSTYLGHFGSIYVPSEYVDYYKTSTTWSYFADRITSIENLPTE